MTGEYYRDASNYYPKGTKYFEVMGISTSIAIAIRIDNQYVRAVYVHKPPFYIMNAITSIYFISVVVIMALLFIVARI
jgi:hypothetical protein